MSKNITQEERIIALQSQVKAVTRERDDAKRWEALIAKERDRHAVDAATFMLGVYDLREQLREAQKEMKEPQKEGEQR